jgi:hypothetical protein
MAYRDVVLAESSLVGFWELQETSGTVATDSTANARSGTYSGGFTLAQPGIFVAAGTRNNAVALNGSSAYINIPAFAVASGGALSVEAWISQTAAGKNGSIAWKNPVNGQWGLFIESGVLKWRGGSSSLTLVGPSLSAASWYHVVATQTGTTATIYVNGVQVASGTVTAIADGTTAGTNDINVGRFNSGYYLNGKITTFALYNAVLTGTQVTTHYTASAQFFVPGTRATQSVAEILVGSGVSAGNTRSTQVVAETLLASSVSTGKSRGTQVVAEVLMSISPTRIIPMTVTLARRRDIFNVTTALKATITRSVPTSATINHFTRTITGVTAMLVRQATRAVPASATLTTTYTRSITGVSASLAKKRSRRSRTERALQHRIVQVLGRRRWWI